MKLFKNDRAYENAHIFIWLIKDSSWVHNWHWLGMAMIIPTLFMQFHITWKNRDDISELTHNVAIALWICANATWMTSEFYFHDQYRFVAAWFFNLGLGLMITYYTCAFIASRKRKSSSNFTALQ
jgi:hypothetical protein